MLVNVKMACNIMNRVHFHISIGRLIVYRTHCRWMLKSLAKRILVREKINGGVSDFVCRQMRKTFETKPWCGHGLERQATMRTWIEQLVRKSDIRDERFFHSFCTEYRWWKLLNWIFFSFRFSTDDQVQTLFSL